MAYDEMTRLAKISPCLRYRYALGRMWDPTRPINLVWCMLNPSTADGTKDDPTIRQCIGFARDWGYGGFIVVNLFAYRSPDPKDLLRVEDPVGPDNNIVWQECMTHHHSIVAAWGSNVQRLGSLANDRIALLRDLAGKRLWTFGMTANGNPLHPLYLSRSRPLENWPCPVQADT